MQVCSREGNQEEAERHHGRVSAVHLRVGALSGVAPEALLSSYEIACAAGNITLCAEFMKFSSRDLA